MGSNGLSSRMLHSNPWNVWTICHLREENESHRRGWGCSWTAPKIRFSWLIQMGSVSSCILWIGKRESSVFDLEWWGNHAGFAHGQGLQVREPGNLWRWNREGDGFCPRASQKERGPASCYSRSKIWTVISWRWFTSWNCGKVLP